MKPLDTDQRIFVVEVAAAVGAVAFVIGIGFGRLISPSPTHPPDEATVARVVQSLPMSVRRDIAIDYCASGKAARRMCAMLPLSSPVEPMDGR